MLPLSVEIGLTLFIQSQRQQGFTHAAVDLEADKEETYFRVVYYMGEHGFTCWEGSSKEVANERFKAVTDWVKLQPGQMSLPFVSFSDGAEELAWLVDRE